MSPFQAPTGTRDVLAPESARVERLVATFAELCRRGCYGLVISPMFEDAAVFRRGIGEQSDVVSKEMYEFEDKGGRHLALRPEGTASIVRAFVQHRPQLPWKVWYVTPAFRYERPQAGRFRQHHQLGVEVLGSEDPDVDVEVIALLSDYLSGVGLNGLQLRLNSMGDGTCRPAFETELASRLARLASSLCSEHRETWERNPLRVLDCKRSECVAVRPALPRIVDALCDDCSTHLRRVKEGLDAFGIAYEQDDFLVRGLDYYTRTTFEFSATGLDAAQNAVGGGGRYDGLTEALGGPATPGIGFGTGIERVLLALDDEGASDAERSAVDCFVIDLVGGAAARDLTRRLRAAGFAVDRAFDGRSMKSQMRAADRSGARLALVVGKEEEHSSTVAVKVLRGGVDRHQEVVGRDVVTDRIRELLG